MVGLIIGILFVATGSKGNTESEPGIVLANCSTEADSEVKDKPTTPQAELQLQRQVLLRGVGASSAALPASSVISSPEDMFRDAEAAGESKTTGSDSESKEAPDKSSGEVQNTVAEDAAAEGLAHVFRKAPRMPCVSKVQGFSPFRAALLSESSHTPAVDAVRVSSHDSRNWQLHGIAFGLL